MGIRFAEEIVRQKGLVNVVIGYERIQDTDCEGCFRLMNPVSIGRRDIDDLLSEQEVLQFITSRRQTWIRPARSPFNDIGRVIARVYDHVDEISDANFPIAVVDRIDLYRNPERVRVGDPLTLYRVAVLADSGYTTILKQSTQSH